MMIYYIFPSNAAWGVFAEDPGQQNLWDEPRDALQAIHPWAYFDSEESEWVNPSPKDIVTLLESVKSLFERYFGEDEVNNRRVSIISTYSTPTTYSRQGIIFLSAKGRHWCQFAYQFSHELCHMMIYDTVPDQMRWFEEAICELASLFFLRRMAKTWSTCAPYPSWTNYAPSLKEYATNVQLKEYELPPDITFCDFFKAQTPMLSQLKNCCHRDINLLCANAILPIFEDHPALWKDVVLLSKIPTNISFEDSLRYWHDHSSSQDAIKEIMQLFGF